MSKNLLFTLLLMAIVGPIAAQNRVITGKVSDDQGAPVPNASILIKGFDLGTTSKDDGTYSLSVPPNAKSLVISVVGYDPREVSIRGQNNIDVAMSTTDKNLSEVVVVAYGTAKKGSYTGSSVVIDDKAIAERPLTNVLNALAGAGPGIQANAGSGQPGSGPNIRIRGFGSVNASNDPLYVVDGVPYSGSIANLNPDDVASISILKDASASALYGSRAANGVVLITTKRGKKGQNQMQVNVTQGFISRGLPEYDMVSAFEYYPLMWEAYRNSLAYASTNPTPLAQASQTATNGIKNLLGYNPFNVPNNDIVRTDGTLNPNASLLYPDDLDWAAPLKRTGSRSDYSLGFSGGSEKSDYFVSVGYVNEKGFVLRSDYERFNGRINVNVQPLSWFKTGLNISGNITKSNQASTTSSTGYVNPFYFARNMGPIYPVYAHDPATGAYSLDASGNKIYDFGNITLPGHPTRPSGGSPGRHVVAETEYNDNLFKRNVLSARTYQEISFLKNFKFTSNVSIDISNYLASTYENKIVGDGAPGGRASRTNSITTSSTFNQLLAYNVTLNNHNVDVLAGHENYDYTYNYLNGYVAGQIVDGNTELGNFTSANSLPDSRTDRHRIESYLSRINYNYANKYFVSGSYRRDGSSKFSKAARWGDFWSVAAGWRIDSENFMKSQDWVDLLKLRVSYGLVGNDNLLDVDLNEDYYLYQALYTLGTNNATEPGFVQASLSNENLLWETNKQFDIGLDFTLFKNRINGSIEYFKRQSDNLLFNVPLPVSSGVLTINKNVGTMYNRGIEVQIGADVIRTKDFTWNINLNATTFKNSITKLPQAEIISGTKKLMVGHSLYDYWLRDWYGVDPVDGAALYAANVYTASNSRVTKGGDTVTTAHTNAKFHYAGSAIPDVYGGITNTFTYKNFDLSFQITYQVGGLVYDATYAALLSTGSYGGSIHKDILQRWKNPGDVTNIPRMDASTAFITTAGSQSDRYLTDASFINFRVLNIGYTLPADFASRIKVQRARFFLSGENLYLSSERKGMNVAQAFTGVTSNVYVPNRIISAGLNITL